jgi:hypothetical protein
MLDHSCKRPKSRGSRAATGVRPFSDLARLRYDGGSTNSPTTKKSNRVSACPAGTSQQEL